MNGDVLSAAVMAEADAAYERGDRQWFKALPTETLAAMWALCCNIETMPSWDDEVYDALYPRGYFEQAVIEPGTLAGDVTQRQLCAADERTKRAFVEAERRVFVGELSDRSSMFDLPLEEFVDEFAPRLSLEWSKNPDDKGGE